MPRFWEKGKQKGKQIFRNTFREGTPPIDQRSNSTAGNLSSNSLPERTACRSRNEEGAASGSSTPTTQSPQTLTDFVAQRILKSAEKFASTNPTLITHDPAGEQIAKATETDAEICTTPEDAAKQSFTKASNNVKIQSLWQRALDDPNWLPHEHKALEKVKAQLQSTTKTIEVTEAFVDIMKGVLDKRQGTDWRLKFGGVDIGIKDVVRKIIAWVDKFKEIGDIIVQFDPVHAALPWAGFRFLLKICLEKQKMVEGILIGLEKMTLLIDRCSIYEFHYLYLDTDPSNQLEKQILNVYTAILKFVINAIDRVDDNHLQAVFTTDDVSEHLRKVEEIQKTVEEYARIVENQNTRENFERVKGFLRELKEINSSIQVQLNTIQQLLEESKRSKILEWISEIPYSKHHAQISNGRLPGTGEWIFRRQEYSDWKHSGTSKLLLLVGIPGAGKTYTASAIIDSFLKTAATQRLGYFYCNQAEEDRRDPQKILSTIIQQLSQTGSKDGLLTPVVKIYEDREATGQKSAELSLKESKELLVQLADLYPNHETIICIDAMDEVNNQTRLDLLESLKDVIARSKSVIKIFVTTRMDRDILRQFKIFPLIELQPNDNATDINYFIETKVQSLFKEKDWHNGDVADELRREICCTLQTRCKGNFQLASLQIQLLRKLEIKEDIQEGLQKLPDTLAKIYEEIYQKICHGSKLDRSARLALNAFRWIQCSHKPLQSEKLLDVVNAEVSSTGEFCTISAVVNAETLLAVCQNLVILDKRLNVFRFAHLSVDEYLETKLPNQDSHSEIASICLSLLCTSSTTWDTLPQSSDDQKVIKALRKKEFLFFYSHVFWPWHFSQCGHITRDCQMIRLWDRFTKTGFGLGDSTYMSRWVRQYELSRKVLWIPYEWETGSFYKRSETFLSLSKPINTNEYTLVCIWIFGLYQVLPAVTEAGVNSDTGIRRSTLNTLLLTFSEKHRDLEIARVLIEKGASVSAINEDGNTPLHLASWGGYKDVAQLLIDSGASVSATNGNGDTPLHRVLFSSDKDMAQLLIDNGGNVSAINGKGDTPLHQVLSYGDKDKAQLLIDNGASVSATDGKGNTALHLASWSGYKDVAELLIDNGATVSATDEDHDTPLHIAALNGHKDVAQLLIDNGASVSAININGDTPLHLASWGGYKVVAQLLIDNSASVSATNGNGDTPLHIASWKGHKGVAQLLIDNSASVSATNANGYTPLHRVLFSTDKELAQLLIDNGGSVSAINGKGDTPLHQVLSYGDKDKAQLLIDNGASVSATDGKGNTALHIASWDGYEDVAELLIDNGASVSATDADSDTPLHIASLNGHKDVAQLLIDNGASVSAININGDTPLHLASWGGHKAVAQLLIDNGAIVSATNGNGYTPLHIASWKGHKGVAQLLIDNGASVSATDADGDTPLHLAAREEFEDDFEGDFEDVAQLLIGNGASVSATNTDGDTPLHIASWKGCKDVAQLLIEEGASMSATNVDGDTPLHVASLNGHKYVAQLLIEKGGGVSATTANGATPLHLALRNGHQGVAHLLISKGATPRNR